MSVRDPKTKAKHDKSGKQDDNRKTGNKQEHADQTEKKDQAFDQGLPNNSNTQTGTSNSGYDERNPKHPGGKQQHGPKVTNQENDITNSEEENKWSEEPVDEKAEGNSTERTDPEIDSPIPDSEKTEKKIPQGGL